MAWAWTRQTAPNLGRTGSRSIIVVQIRDCFTFLIIISASITHQALGGPRFQEGTRSAKDKLERHGQERLARNGTYLGRGGGGSSQQTRMASECGPIRSRVRGMNQVKSAYYSPSFQNADD